MTPSGTGAHGNRVDHSMTRDFNRLKVTMQQMERLMLPLDDLRENVLPKEATLFAAMAEGPLEDLNRLRMGLSQYVDELQPTA